MNTEEEFYLGDNVDDFDFYLGDSIEDVEEDKKDVTEIDASYKELLDVYELLKIQEKPYEVGYEECEKEVKDFLHNLHHANLVMIHA